MQNLRQFCLVIIYVMTVVGLLGCGKPSPDELFEEGSRLMMQKNFVSARHRFEELVKNHPDFDLVPFAKMNIADCFNFDNKPDDARVLYEKIIVEYPNTVHSWMANVRLGDMSRQEKEYEKADTFYQAAIASVTEESRRLTAINNRIATFMEAQQPDKAIELLKQLIQEAKDPQQRLSAAVGLRNVYLNQDKKDEAWQVIAEMYDKDYPADLLEPYMELLMRTASVTGKYKEGFAFYDKIVSDITHEETHADILYYKARLATSTLPYTASGVAMLEDIHQRFPKTPKGRWSDVDAALAVYSATTIFPDATSSAKVLLDRAVRNYDDIVNDMTMEWFEPMRAAWAWNRLSVIHEIRAQLFQSMDDLKEASRTLAQIPKRFPTLPQQVQYAKEKLQNFAYMMQVAETSPEYFWEQAKASIRGTKLPASNIESATAETDAAPVTP